jgi:hypothetical protein
MAQVHPDEQEIGHQITTFGYVPLKWKPFLLAALELYIVSPVVAAQVANAEWVSLVWFGQGIQASANFPPLSHRTWKALAIWITGYCKSYGQMLSRCVPETSPSCGIE